MARKQTHECRNCGAPLGIPDDHERYFTCQYCGSVLEDIATPEERQAGQVRITIAGQPSLDLETLQTYAKPAQRGCAAAGIGLLAVVGSIVAAVFAFSGEGNRAIDAITDAVDGQGDIYNYAAASSLASDDNTGGDVVTIARTADGLEVRYLDFDASPPARWAVPTDVENEVFAQFVATDDLVVMNAGDQLVALNRGSGAEAWRATLSDAVRPNICAGCLRRVGETVVTLTADGVLGAHSLAGGEPLWSVVLQETPRQVVRYGDDVGVLDTADGVTALHVHGAPDGALRHRLPLACNDPNFGDRRAVGIYDVLLQGPENSVVYLADPSSGGCAQLWRAGSPDSAAWEVAYEYPYFGGVEPQHVRVTPAGILVAAGTSIDLLSTESGSPRRVADFPDADLVPVGVAEGVAVVAAESTRGTASWSLLGVDLATGNLKWTIDLEAGDALTDGHEFAVRDAWTAAITSGGVSVLQYRSDDVELVSQTIPVASGTISAPKRIDLSGRGLGDTVTAFSWAGDDFHLSVDGAFVVVDGVSGEIRAETT